ncbi:MAG: oligosaccharide flippase family protein [bacterium]
MMAIKEKLVKKTMILQKILKIDLKYLLKGGFWLTAKQGVVSIFSLALTIGMANLLDKEIYGIFRYIISVASVLMIASLSGISTSIIESTARGYEKTFFPALKTCIKWGFLGGIASLLIAFYYYSRGNITLSIGFVIVSIFIPFFNSLNLYDAILVGRKDFRKSAIFCSIVQMTASIVLILTLLKFNNLYVFLISYFLIFSVMRFIITIISTKTIDKESEIDEENIKYGKHLSIMDIFGTLAKHIDKILVFNYIGAADLAIYAFATAPPEYVSSFLGNAKNLVFPKYASADKKEIKKTLLRKMFLFTLVVFCTIILYIIFAPLVYNLIFPQYGESIFYSRIFAISLITVIGTLPLSLLQAEKKIMSLYKYNTIIPFISIIILFFSVQFGLFGIILGRVITRYVNLIYVTYLAKKD